MNPNSKGKRQRTGLCPECQSTEVIPVIHGHVTPAMQRAVDEGQAILADREEWEGLTEWYCKSCGCDWSGEWRRFKIPGGVNATRSKPK
jgi:hypothetical protein